MFGILVAVVALAVLLLPLAQGVYAAWSASAANPGNVITSTALGAPSGLNVSYAGHDASLSWSAGTNGNGYQVLGAANGTSSDCSGASWAQIGTTGGTLSYNDANRYAPQGTYYCYQVKTSYGSSWTSIDSNPITSTRIGVVATAVSLVNDGNHAGCSGSGAQVYGQAGLLDCGDQIAVTFNQPIDTATGPQAGNTVCVSQSANAVFLGTSTASGPCDGAVYAVGTFSKTTGSAPASQTVAHNLGITPKAIILWSEGQSSSGSFGSSFLDTFGFYDGSNGYAVAGASRDGMSSSTTARRMVALPISFIRSDRTVTAEASITSWDSTNVSLNWTSNDSNAYVIHYIVIGGSSVSAKAVAWKIPPSTGNVSVTGVGFQPGIVLHAMAGTAATSLPYSGGTFVFNLGAMDSSGNQWASVDEEADNSNPSDGCREQLTNSIIAVVNTCNDGALNTKASYVSMDADGFTTNFSLVNGSQAYIFSLALAGIPAKAGAFTKTTSAAPASQTVSGTGFQPALVMLKSVQATTSSSSNFNARSGFGASDGVTEAAGAHASLYGAGTTDVDTIDKTNKVFVKVDNSSRTINAEADLTGFTSDGFTLNWTTNDAVATQLGYVAFGVPTGFSEAVSLGKVSGTSISGGSSRFSASYTWSNGNKTLTVTIGARVAGSDYPAIAAGSRTLYPTTDSSKLKSSTGAFHICDSNGGGGNCLPATSSGP